MKKQIPITLDHSKKANGGVATAPDRAESAWRITDYEQNVIVVPVWVAMNSLTLGPIRTGPIITDAFSRLAVSSTPGGLRLRTTSIGGTVIAPGVSTGASLANTTDRWQWISDRNIAPVNLPGYSHGSTTLGVLDAWNRFGAKTTYVSRSTEFDGKERFSIVSRVTRILPLIPTFDMLWTDEDDVK